MNRDDSDFDIQGAVVVLDTNVLDQSSLLKDPLSVALLSYLVRMDGKFGLPAIVRREWLEHWEQHVEKKVTSLGDTHSWLRGHFPEIADVELTLDAEAALNARLEDLGDLLLEEQISTEDWRDAGEMVISKRPPNSAGSQQFKDSLLWRALLRMGEVEGRVALVTADKGFTDADGALEPELQAEAIEHGVEIAVFRNVKQVLELMESQSDALVASVEHMWLDIENPFRAAVNAALDEHWWELAATGETSHEVFATGDPEVVAVAIHLESLVADLLNPDFERDDAYVKATGSALVNIRTWESNTEVEEITVVVATPHGEVVTRVTGSRASGPQQPSRRYRLA